MTNSIGDIVEGLIAAENRLRQITLDKKPVPGGVFEAHALVRQSKFYRERSRQNPQVNALDE